MATLLFFGILTALGGFLISPVVGAILLIAGKRQAGIGVLVVCPCCMVLSIMLGAASLIVDWDNKGTAVDRPGVIQTYASSPDDTNNTFAAPTPTTAPPVACDASNVQITESFIPSAARDVNVSFDVTNSDVTCTLDTNAMKVGVDLSNKTHLTATSEAGDDAITLGPKQVTSFSLDFPNATVATNCNAISKYEVSFGKSTDTFAPNDLAMCPSIAPTMSALSAPAGGDE